MSGSTKQQIDDLEDWEFELLFELKLLEHAGLLGPVLDAITAGLETICIEGERREAQRAQKPRKPRRDTQENRPLEEPLEEVGLELRKQKVKRQVASKTTAGRKLHSGGYHRNEVLSAMFDEIAQKARQNAINRCRRYVGATL